MKGRLIISAVHLYILIAFIFIAFYLDITTSRIPNWLTVSGMTAGIMSQLVQYGLDGLMEAFFGLLSGGGIVLLLYFFRAVGGGDVKLFAAIGALAGVELVLYSLVYSIIYAGIIGIIILLFTKTILIKLLNALYAIIQSIKNKEMTELETFKKNEATTFPFMYAVLPGVATAFFYVVI